MPGRAQDGCPLFKDESMDMTTRGHKENQAIICNAIEYPLTGTDFTPNNEGGILGASLATKHCFIKVTGLKVGDEIIGYKLKGRVTSGGNAVTVDADFQKVPTAGTPADPTGDGSNDITQVSKTAGYTFGATEEVTFTAPYTVVIGETYNIDVDATTLAATTAIIHGAEVIVNRK